MRREQMLKYLTDERRQEGLEKDLEEILYSTQQLIRIEDINNKMLTKLIKVLMEENMSINPEQIQAIADALESQPSTGLVREEVNNLIDKKLNKAMDTAVSRVLTAQEANRAWWSSPIVVGGVAVAVLVCIGGTFYLFNKRLKRLEEIQIAKD